jgi:hypothetical protein
MDTADGGVVDDDVAIGVTAENKLISARKLDLLTLRGPFEYLKKRHRDSFGGKPGAAETSVRVNDPK